MNKKNKPELTLGSALGALAIGFVTIGFTNISATAAPIKADLQLAQVGVRSRITPPTPLNLRPRTHIPLPESNYSSYPSRGYSRHNTYYDNSHRHDHHYGDGDRTHYGHNKRNRHRNGGTVIIISPGNHSGSNYSNNGYIRVIGQ